MSTRSHITNITPLPPSISRDTALSLLHDHRELIQLNPLVIKHEKTKPHPSATLEEQVNCIWYSITDTINYLPGGLAKSEVSYKAGFYDLPTGLQTHCFAPGGVDLRAIWRVGGNMPGEQPEAPELGVDKPVDGLYLREDVEVKCNMFLSGFVKKNLRKAHHTLVERLLDKYSNVPSSMPRPPSFAGSPTGSADSVQRISTPGTTRSLHTLSIPRPVSRQLHSTAPSPSHLPSPYAEPCACGSGGHEVMCPNYRYGTPAPERNSKASAVVSAREVSRPSVDTRWPPRADAASPTSTESYSPAGLHPEAYCDCLESNHTLFCQYYKPASVQVQQPKPTVQQHVQSNSHGRIVWTSSGSNPSIAYRSPQHFGEQAELPGNTSTSVRDEHFGSMAVPEPDSTELAYWKMGIVGDLKASPGDAGWL
ncbi:hypothetical protein LTR62_006750 [Meristemomyces frigidus]|uniref:DUF7053 domain-containing protein n=1 Tax=Meristemomyces frigidus TaxID=1508187 RepID=A0AAN7YJK8_9PEZI|nr:hypothetical protein LTR62_006750 [Meristemomyces frigidus]